MEKRHQKRIAKYLLAEVKVTGGNFFAYVQDISKKGLGFLCNNSLEMGEELEITLNVPKRATMHLKGRVVWHRELPVLSKNKYHYGIALTDHPDEYDLFVELLLKQQYERRKHPRFSATLVVKNADVLDLLDAATSDVSAGGLYIRTTLPLIVGDQHEIELSGDQLAEPILCLGEVVHVFDMDLDDENYPFGAGIKIISFVGDGSKRFTDYLKGLEELYRFHWPPDLEEMTKKKEEQEEKEDDEDIPIEIE